MVYWLKTLHCSSICWPSRLVVSLHPGNGYPAQQQTGIAPCATLSRSIQDLQGSSLLSRFRRSCPPDEQRCPHHHYHTNRSYGRRRRESCPPPLYIYNRSKHISRVIFSRKHHDRITSSIVARLCIKLTYKCDWDQQLCRAYLHTEYLQWIRLVAKSHFCLRQNSFRRQGWAVFAPWGTFHPSEEMWTHTHGLPLSTIDDDDDENANLYLEQLFDNFKRFLVADRGSPRDFSKIFSRSH